MLLCSSFGTSASANFFSNISRLHEKKNMQLHYKDVKLNLGKRDKEKRHKEQNNKSAQSKELPVPDMKAADIIH